MCQKLSLGVQRGAGQYWMIICVSESIGHHSIHVCQHLDFTAVTHTEALLQQCCSACISY